MCILQGVRKKCPFMRKYNQDKRTFFLDTWDIEIEHKILEVRILLKDKDRVRIWYNDEKCIKMSGTGYCIIFY